MDSLVILDAGAVIRDALTGNPSAPISAERMHGSVGQALGVAAGAGYRDPFLLVVFDEPPTPAVPFHPHWDRRSLADGYGHFGYDVSDPALRIPVQVWKQGLYRSYKVLSYPGAEARDLIAFLLDSMQPFGDDAPPTIIRSDDPLLLQCVDDGRSITMSGPFSGGDDPYPCDSSSVRGYMGIGPAGIRMLATVAGDRADGYRGIPECRDARRGADIVRDAGDIHAIASRFPEDSGILVRNWRLADIGVEHLDRDSMSRVRDTMALVMGPEF